MKVRKNWLWLSLALLCVLALSSNIFSSGQGNDGQAAKLKMPGVLQQLCASYKDFGTQKLTQITRSQLNLVKESAITPEKKARIQLLQKMLGPDAAEKEFNSLKTSTDARLLERFVLPELQKRWDNPSFDVASGIIQATSNPRSLESAHLKIRKTWKQGASWKAFCEFAIFKAEEIASRPEVKHLTIMPAATIENDLGSASTGAPRLRTGMGGNWHTGVGFTGQGVIVGDVDSGVDWHHGDFLFPDGSSRILYIWDTTVDTPGRDPETLFGMIGFNYGTVWTKAEIDGGSCTEFDGRESEVINPPYAYSGHGTHTLGTAAGNGGATGNYTGMAPNADIICVKGLDAMGVEFIFEMASRLGRPAVVNNSWGLSWAMYGPYYGLTYLFPGDGSDYYSQYFNYVQSRYPLGKIIVKSAGNNGMWKTYRDHDDYGFALYRGSLHFGGRSKYNRPINHIYRRINHDFGYGMRREYSDMMIRSNVPVQVKVIFLGHGQSFTMSTGSWGYIPGASALGYGTTFYDLDQGQDIYNNEYMGTIWFDAEPSWGATAFFPEGNWDIQVTPLNPLQVAKYDVWLYSRRSWYNPPWVYSFYDSCFTLNSSHAEYQLDWAASPNVITVGAWTTRSSWLGADGYMHYPWGFMEPWINTITYFSSPGPNRNGHMKPDIAAPGAAIMSSLARTAGSNSSGSTVSPLANSEKDPDLQHQWMWGTSMAAPHATGAIALILQKFPGQNIAQIRDKITGWAKKDIFTKTIGPNGFGAGKLSVEKLKTPPVAVLSVDKKTLDLSAKQTATFSAAGSHDPDKLPFKLKWSVISSPAGAVFQFSPNGGTATLVPDPNKIGTYKVGLVAEGVFINSPMAQVSVLTVE